jgi:hypothetical protein
VPDVTYVAIRRLFVPVAFVHASLRAASWVARVGVPAHRYGARYIEPAICDRAPTISHITAIRGTPNISLRDADRLAVTGIEPSVGTRGDSHYHPPAEPNIDLFKASVIQRQGPWRPLEPVELATLTSVDWITTPRLLGCAPPREG